jgi:hypothetical protein
MKPEMSDPRRTDEVSAQALFRLQVEPEREYPATSAMANQDKPGTLASVRYATTAATVARVTPTRPGARRSPAREVFVVMRTSLDH